VVKLLEQSLAILVTSSRHPEYVRQLARSARQAGKAVKVHFAGTGVHLATSRMLAYLAGWAEVTVCMDSAADEAASRLKSDGLLAPASRLVELVGGCDRYVVF
jgi:hypothetical protein